jgi:pimeloyl-ACP methyl ester carboxylesterase
MVADKHGSDVFPGLGQHELVLLHGQPGSSADWDLVADRLPLQLHAIAADRPGYGTNPLPAGGFAANAHGLISDLNARHIDRAVLVGHSYGGGIALSAARIVPDRVEAVVLLASVGPQCINIWDRVLAAPLTGPACALMAWKLTPWIARARLAAARRSTTRSLRPSDYVNWQVWGYGDNAHGTLWRTFLIEQRALLREVTELERALPSIAVPVLIITDPRDAIVGVETAHRLAEALPDASLRLISGGGHHLPRRSPSAVVAAMTAFLAALDAKQAVSAASKGCSAPSSAVSA